MLKIEMKINGQKASAGALRNVLEEAAVSSVSHWVRKRVANAKCHAHGEGSAIAVVGTGLKDLRFEISACCEEFKDSLERKLSEE